MAEAKSKTGNRDRRRGAISQEHEVEVFHRKHKHLTHQEAVLIIKEANGDLKRADELAERVGKEQ